MVTCDPTQGVAALHGVLQREESNSQRDNRANDEGAGASFDWHEGPTPPGPDSVREITLTGDREIAT
jgi:hypothetical protein